LVISSNSSNQDFYFKVYGSFEKQIINFGLYQFKCLYAYILWHTYCIYQILIMKPYLILIPFLFLLFSCSKEKYPRVEYRVTSNSSAAIAYTMATNSLRQEVVSGNWRISFRHEQGATVLLSALHTGLGTTTISVYVNKELLYMQSTQIPGQTIQIFETLP